MEVYAKAKFSELVGDFIKDEAGIWWLVNIKAVSLDNQIFNEDLKKITFAIDDFISVPHHAKGRKGKKNVKQKKCWYCEEDNNVDELNKKLTLKMMLQMDKHLQQRGKTYEWLYRSEYKYLDTSNLYETYHVCKTCYLLYEKINELVTTYQDFSKYVGVNMDIDKTGELVSITSIKKPTNEVAHASTTILKDASDLDKNEVKLNNNHPISLINNKVLANLNRYRIILMMHYVENIPYDIDTKYNYWIDFELFGYKIRYKLDLMTNATLQANSNYGTIENLKKQNEESASSRQGRSRMSSIRDEFYDKNNQKRQDAYSVGNCNKQSIKVDINKLKLFYFFSEDNVG